MDKLSYREVRQGRRFMIRVLPGTKLVDELLQFARMVVKIIPSAIDAPEYPSPHWSYFHKSRGPPSGHFFSRAVYSEGIEASYIDRIAPSLEVGFVKRLAAAQNDVAGHRAHLPDMRRSGAVSSFSQSSILFDDDRIDRHIGQTGYRPYLEDSVLFANVVQAGNGLQVNLQGFFDGHFCVVEAKIKSASYS